MNDGEGTAAADDWESALAEQEAVESAQPSDNVADDPANTDSVQPQKADLNNLEPGGGEEITVEDASLDVILDIPVTISLEVGNTKISIRNLLKLNQGSVVELDRLAGEPLDVLVNGTLIAHAEVVVVNEKYGIRLTDVISAAERIKKLK
ncbi:MAG: flagellar motor switch protein FliN [Thiohalomonadales bacterium]